MASIRCVTTVARLCSWVLGGPAVGRLSLAKERTAAKMLSEVLQSFRLSYLQDLLGMVPKPVVAVLLLFPITDKTEAARRERT